MDEFDEVFDRWAGLDQGTDRSWCGGKEPEDSRESQAKAEDPFVHRAVDAGFFDDPRNHVLERRVLGSEHEAKLQDATLH